MGKWALLAATLVLAVPAVAAGMPARLALGYSFVSYLGEGGNTPRAAFLALSGKGTLTLELDLGWQRGPTTRVSMDTYTAAAGPKISFATEGRARPFVHVLFGLRHAELDDAGLAAAGWVAGGGFDIGAGRVRVRLGADFQAFGLPFAWFGGSTARLGVGLAF